MPHLLINMTHVSYAAIEVYALNLIFLFLRL